MGQLVFQATLGGQVNLVGPNTASTFNINVPAIAGTMVTTGDTGTVTNTMLASSAYAIPGTIGSTTPNSGAFTTLSASSTVSGTGFSTYLSSPPAIGNTTANTGAFTTLSASSTVSGTGFSTYLASPPAIGSTTANTGAFTTLTATNFNAASTFGFKNRIINGAMVIDQRNAGASVSIGSTQYPVDRFAASIQQGSGHTAQRSSTAPSGFINSVLITIGTGASPAAGNVSRIFQGIEGFNVLDLNWGSSNAQTITLSFWVRSSLTGTFAGGIYNGASNRTYVFTYTINSANTWEQKTLTIAGDTTGTWSTDNTAGMYVNWDLGSGSTYQGTAGVWAAGSAWATSGSVKLAATSGATFYITGVQLEKGSTATSFDYRPYGTELMLCQRYYFAYASGSTDYQELVARTSLTAFDLTTYVPATMRALPSVVLPSGSVYGRLVGYDSTFVATVPNVTALSVIAAGSPSLSQIHMVGTNASMTFAAGQGSTSFDTNNNTAGLGLSAEL